MKRLFKDKKFHLDKDSGRSLIRYELLPSRKIITFGIALTGLTSMEDGNDDVDFDKESDEIIKKFHDSKTHHIFEYVPGFGFSGVDTEEQKWFVFPL